MTEVYELLEFAHWHSVTDVELGGGDVKATVDIEFFARAEGFFQGLFRRDDVGDATSEELVDFVHRNIIY